MNVWDSYCLLWGKASTVCAIHYESRRDRGGMHHALSNTIAIYRSFPPTGNLPSRERCCGQEPLNDEELLDELMTLAHEYGHALNQRFNSFWLSHHESRIRYTSGHPLSEDDRMNVYREECWAWVRARRVLRAVLDDGLMKTFEPLREEALGTYQKRLGISDEDAQALRASVDHIWKTDMHHGHAEVAWYEHR